MGSALHRSVNRPEPNELAYSDRSDNLNVNTDLPYPGLSIRFKVGGYLGMAPAGVILEVQNFFSLENF